MSIIFHMVTLISIIKIASLSKQLAVDGRTILLNVQIDPQIIYNNRSILNGTQNGGAGAAICQMVAHLLLAHSDRDI